MLNDKKVSVIVPCYNVESYLSKCIESILNQTYKNIEIICINDGSKDNTLSLLKKYQSDDKRIVLINKKNAGVSAARNDGLKKATGDYVLFVDSDDYIDEKMVEILLTKSLENDADIIKCNRADVYLKTNSIINRKPIWNEEKVFLEKDFSKQIYPEFLRRNKLCNIWMTLIKKELLQSNNILFDETLAVNEDEVFSTQIFCIAKKFVYLPNVLYFYVKNENGLSANGTNIIKRFESRKKHSQFIYEITAKWGYNQNDKIVIEKIAFLAIHTLFQTAVPNVNYTKKEQYKLFLKIINDDLFKSNLFKSKGSIMLFPEKILLFFIKYRCYRLGFIYARGFEQFVRKNRHKLEKLRKA